MTILEACLAGVVIAIAIHYLIGHLAGTNAITHLQAWLGRWRRNKALRARMFKVESTIGSGSMQPFGTVSSFSIEPLRPSAPPAQDSTRAGWFPMPGNRLEYKATGFYVQLQADHPAAAYQLFTPEGHRVAYAPFLLQVQECGEKMAADREAFTPAALNPIPQPCPQRRGPDPDAKEYGIKGSAANALLTPIAGAVAIALALSWLGPALEDEPDRRHESAAADKAWREEVMADRWEADARRRCAAFTGDNGTYIRVAGGGIVCTDKRGRKVATQEVQP